MKVDFQRGTNESEPRILRIDPELNVEAMALRKWRELPFYRIEVSFAFPLIPFASIEVHSFTDDCSVCARRRDEPAEDFKSVEASARELVRRALVACTHLAKQAKSEASDTKLRQLVAELFAISEHTAAELLIENGLNARTAEKLP